jgi:hypothetical protein
MDNYWPTGLKLDDTQSPMEILRIAQKDWITNSNGILALVLQEAASKSGNEMIIVHAKHVSSNRSVTLFSVVHRPNAPYPATIQPKEDDLPDFLKKSYYKRGISDISAAFMGSQGQTVENKWVSETPAVFREKLKNAFNLDLVKSEILNLISVSSNDTNDESPKPSDEQTQED